MAVSSNGVDDCSFVSNLRLDTQNRLEEKLLYHQKKGNSKFLKRIATAENTANFKDLQNHYRQGHQNVKSIKDVREMLAIDYEKLQ